MNSVEIKAQVELLLKETPSVNIDILFLYVPAFNLLHEIMNPNETIKAYCYSNLESSDKVKTHGKWLLICTENRLLLIQKTVFSDLKSIEILFENLDSIEIKKGWFFNEIIIKTKDLKYEMFHVGKRDLEFFLAKSKETISKFFI